MVKLYVKQTFVDKYTKITNQAGAVIEVTEERQEEILASLGPDFIAKVTIEEFEAPEGDGGDDTGGDDSGGGEEAFPKAVERGKYQLSDGTIFEGNKKEATEAEKALAE